MYKIGIICEYNPFHNGHLYHINEIRKQYPEDTIVLILSGNVTQRGELSIINKWDKTRLALQYGIDLVVELPYLYASQAADIFCAGALKLLDILQVDKLVFGSELGTIQPLIECAKTQIYSDTYKSKVKEYLKQGINYPTALSKALKDVTNYDISNPNDILGLGYIKEIIKNNYHIEPITIKRTNNYHDAKYSGPISSATSIRKMIKDNKDITEVVPKEVLSYIYNPVFLSDFFNLIKYKIITDDNLNKYVSIDEMIVKRLKDKILDSNSLDEFINKVKTKHYTYNRLMRMCNHILFDFTKEENEKQKSKIYIRILGFSSKGKKHLKNIKKTIDIPIITNYSNDKNNLLAIDTKVTKVISLLKGKAFLDEEIKQKPIIY